MKNLSQKFPSKKYKGFTLVELIVVITILVILGTIAFVQLWGFADSARDSARITLISNLKTWLDMFQIKSWTYPLPDWAVNITASGVSNIIWYQGYAKDQIWSIAKLSPWGTLDPLDPTIYTTYSVNQNQSKMQLMTFLEDGSNVTAFVPNALSISNASASSTSDYSKRYPKTLGDTLWILLSTASGTINQPVQESGSGVDILNTTGSYMMYMSKDQKFVWTWSVLKAWIGWWGLVGYWSFDEGSGAIAYDRSGNWYNGKLNGNSLLSWWKIWNLLTFNGEENDCITITGDTNLNIKGELTLSVWINNTWTWIWSQSDWWGIIIAKHFTHNSRSYDLSVPNDSRKLRFGICDLNNTCYVLESNASINYNQKYFVTSTYSKSTWRIKIYINGKLDNTINNWLINVMETTIPFTIGCYLNSVDGNILRTYFKGGIGETRMYSRALSDSEVQTLYNSTK